MTSPAAAIVAALSQQRLPCHDEKALQAAVSDALQAAGIDHQREVPVTGGIIDVLAGAVGIEVKIKGQGREIYRQVGRYAEDPRIDEFIVVSGKALALPPMVGGKRCRIVSVGRAWL
jgi:hypothetical protein